MCGQSESLQEPQPADPAPDARKNTPATARQATFWSADPLWEQEALNQCWFNLSRRQPNIKPTSRESDKQHFDARWPTGIT